MKAHRKVASALCVIFVILVINCCENDTYTFEVLSEAQVDYSTQPFDDSKFKIKVRAVFDEPAKVISEDMLISFEGLELTTSHRDQELRYYYLLNNDWVPKDICLPATDLPMVRDQEEESSWWIDINPGWLKTLRYSIKMSYKLRNENRQRETVWPPEGSGSVEFIRSISVPTDLLVMATRISDNYTTTLEVFGADNVDDCFRSVDGTKINWSFSSGINNWSISPPSGQSVATLAPIDQAQEELPVFMNVQYDNGPMKCFRLDPRDYLQMNAAYPTFWCVPETDTLTVYYNVHEPDCP